MKKRIALILSALLVFSFVSCSGGGDDGNVSKEEPSSAVSEAVSPEEPSSAESKEESSEEPSEEVSDVEIERTWPCVTGTFVQPGAFMGYQVKNWVTHFNNLKEVGIDTFIIQWTAETPYGKFSSIYYPSEAAKANKASSFFDGSTFLPRVLEAAKQTGMKVFVGLNLSDEWWSFACSKDDWNKYESDLGVKMAKEIYDLYKKDYPDELYGWYFAYEMFNGMQNQEKKAGEFLNMYLEPLTELDPSMPVMLSPFVTQWGCNAKKAGEEWTKVFEVANFREGDIFCCQDAVGAGHITIDMLDGYFSELKKAVDTEPGLQFWANSEDFTSDYQSADLNRFVRQMKIAEPYVTGYVTFAYSHYYAKDYNGKGGYHEAYKHYYNTGDTGTGLKVENVTFEKKDDNTVRAEVTISGGAAYKTVTYKATGSDEYVYTLPLSKADEETVVLHYNVKLDPEKKDETYLKITVTDYAGNKKSTTVKVETN